MSLPKANRLSLRQNRDLFSAGQKLYSQHFTLIRHCESRTRAEAISDSKIDNLRSTEPQFAILVSKKTAKKAHDRNKIRRLAVSALQNLLSRHCEKCNHDAAIYTNKHNHFPSGQYLVIPKSSVFTTPFSDLLSDLSSLLPKI